VCFLNDDDFVQLIFSHFVTRKGVVKNSGSLKWKNVNTFDRLGSSWNDCLGIDIHINIIMMIPKLFGFKPYLKHKTNYI